MKGASWSRSLLVAASLAFCSTDAWAEDILANGNFADGKAHWKGDGKDAGGTNIDDISASMNNQGKAGAMAVALKNGWTSVSQVFHTRETSLLFSLTYKTSPDFALGGGGPMMGGAKMILERLVGFPLSDRPTPGAPPQRPSPPEPGSALVVIADPSQNEVIYAYAKLAAAPDSQTTTTRIDGLMAHEEKTLYVAFPPGKGTITFSNISLTKPDSAPAPSSNPFQH